MAKQAAIDYKLKKEFEMAFKGFDPVVGVSSHSAYITLFRSRIVVKDSVLEAWAREMAVFGLHANPDSDYFEVEIIGFGNTADIQVQRSEVPTKEDMANMINACEAIVKREMPLPDGR